ncbi:glycosyltransferase [Pontibacter sp. JAM-7]|uniref:glycosyltransferase n=1 Tax=Pontibacter sp. JAM-7 TaxID=3366581 RepID=UPI003AF5454F
MITVMQVCGGKNPGGAEAHFLRFCVELAKFENINVVPVVRRNSWLAGQLQHSDLLFHTLPFLGRHDFWTRAKLKRIARDTNTQVTQCWMSRAASVMPKMTGVKHIGRLGGYYALKNFRNMNWLVAATEDLRQHVIQGGHPAVRSCVIPNFVNPAQTENLAVTQQLREKLQLQEKTVLFTPARLHPVKGLDTAIQALAQLPDNYCYIIAGQGPDEAKLKQQAEALGLTKRVIFTGWTDNISQYCYLSDAFIVPSRHEPFGSVLLEAWSHHLPLISSDSQGATAITRHGKNALIFAKDDVAQLAQSISNLFADDRLRSQLTEQGYQEFADHYTAASVLRTYQQLYQRLAESQ